MCKRPLFVQVPDRLHRVSNGDLYQHLYGRRELRRLRPRVRRGSNLHAWNMHLPVGTELLQRRMRRELGHRLRFVVQRVPLQPSVRVSDLQRRRVYQRLLGGLHVVRQLMSRHELRSVELRRVRAEVYSGVCRRRVRMSLLRLD